VCDVLGHCQGEAAGKAVALGEPCGSGAVLAQGCAKNGNRFDGICFSYRDKDPLICEKSCYADDNDYDGDADDGANDPDCAASEFCAVRFSSRLGVCQPDPVCGDGKFGEVGEACDDHNNVSGDGCSGDCKSVEYAVLCAAAPQLAPDGSVQASTQGGLDGFQGSCQAGVSRGRVYTLTPPGPGQLELTLTSETQQTIWLRRDCIDDSSELACGALDSGKTKGSLAYQVTDAVPLPLSVHVNAFTTLEEGSFTLAAKFTPQVCGDGLKVGAEACDDGNQVPNDGCSADCSTIEYDFWCDSAPALTTGKTISADIDGAPHLFKPSCGYGEGGDRLYRFTATKAGLLQVSLNQLVGGTETDLALSLLGSCSPAADKELACSAVLSPAEELNVEVTKGQLVYVAVDGLFAAAGKYELNATLN
jgi:cysteine-rich repeat protein